MGVVDDLLITHQRLAFQRYNWEKIWRDVVALAMPMASHVFDQTYFGSTAGSLTGLASGPNSERRSREIFDDTAVWALSRLSAGMGSLVVPRAQRWHSLALSDPFAMIPTDEEAEWLDYLRDYLFGARYNPRANFETAIGKAIRGTCGLGTGLLFVEENQGQRRDVDPALVPSFFREVPIVQAYLGVDSYDDLDRVHRVIPMTARAAVQYFTSEKVSQKVRDYANDPRRADTEFTFMHCVMPRGEAGEYKAKRETQPWASFWIEIEGRHLVSASGFNSMPYQAMWWEQTSGSPYGESPIMQCLSEIKLLQHVKKDTLRASQQLVRPPLAVAEGMFNTKINLNSGAINPNMIDGNGRLKVMPITTVSNPSFAERLIEAQRTVIREGTYVSLFQTLVDNPRMTATEALIRNNEKGELLGPAGSKIEAALAMTVDREISIIGGKGAFDPGSPLEPPSTIVDRDVQARFTGPLAMMRRTQDMQGVQAVLQIAGVIAQYDQSVAQKIDPDATLDIVQEVSGAPRRMLRTDAEIAELREQQAQGQEQQAAMQAMQATAGAMKDGGAGLASMARAGAEEMA